MNVTSMRGAVALAGVVWALAPARTACAQTTWSDHARISVNVGAQQAASTFSGTTMNPIYGQTSTLTTSYSVPKGQFFDGGVTLRISGGFGIDVSASAFSKSQTAPVSGTIPHPFVMGVERPISGVSPELERSEVAGYIDAAYVFSARGVDLVVSAGPAFFTVNQDLVGNVTFAEGPFNDTVAFTGAVVSRETATSIGFNAGIDLGVKLSKYVGVGGLFRYSRASVTLPLEGAPSGVHTDAGGPQIGGGVRIYF